MPPPCPPPPLPTPVHYTRILCSSHIVPNANLWRALYKKSLWGVSVWWGNHQIKNGTLFISTMHATSNTATWQPLHCCTRNAAWRAIYFNEELTLTKHFRYRKAFMDWSVSKWVAGTLKFRIPFKPQPVRNMAMTVAVGPGKWMFNLITCQSDSSYSPKAED